MHAGERSRSSRILSAVMPHFSPAETVLKTGFSLDTLRYYEKIGLLDQISRAASGQRRFSDEDISWLGMLRCLRETGMPIAEMLRFAELTRGGDETIAERVNLLEAHDRRVEERIASLREQQRAIRAKISYYIDVAANAS